MRDICDVESFRPRLLSEWGNDKKIAWARMVGAGLFWQTVPAIFLGTEMAGGGKVELD